MILEVYLEFKFKIIIKIIIKIVINIVINIVIMMDSEEYRQNLYKALKQVNTKFLVRSGTAQEYINSINKLVILHKRMGKEWYKNVDED